MSTTKSEQTQPNDADHTEIVSKTNNVVIDNEWNDFEFQAVKRHGPIINDSNTDNHNNNHNHNNNSNNNNNNNNNRSNVTIMQVINNPNSQLDDYIADSADASGVVTAENSDMESDEDNSDSDNEHITDNDKLQEMDLETQARGDQLRVDLLVIAENSTQPLCYVGIYNSEFSTLNLLTMRQRLIKDHSAVLPKNWVFLIQNHVIKRELESTISMQYIIDNNQCALTIRNIDQTKSSLRNSLFKNLK